MSGKEAALAGWYPWDGLHFFVPLQVSSPLLDFQVRDLKGRCLSLPTTKASLTALQTDRCDLTRGCRCPSLLETVAGVAWCIACRKSAGSLFIPRLYSSKAKG